MRKSTLSMMTPFCDGKDQTENCTNSSVTIVLWLPHGLYMKIRTHVDEAYLMIRPYSSASRKKRPVHQEFPATSLTLQSSHPSQEVMPPISLQCQILPHPVQLSRPAPMNPTTNGVFSTVTILIISSNKRLTTSIEPFKNVRITRVTSITKLLNSQLPTIDQCKSTKACLMVTGETSDSN